MPKMEESVLLGVLAAEKADALSADQAAKLTEDRERAMSYYNGDVSEDMPSQPDRSKAVSSDVADTVDGLMPSLMEIFCGGDEVVKFSPVGPEDEEAAQQETDYINHVMMQENDGFLVIYSFAKDALLSKNGIVKVHWEETEEEEENTFLGQTDDVYALLVSAPGVEITEHTERQEEDELGQPMTVHDVTIVTKEKCGRCRIDPVPPEEFGVSKNAKLGQPLDYSFHQVKRTESELIRQGYDPEQVKDLPDSPLSQNEENTTRDTVDEGQGTGDAINKANRLITVVEHYAMLDYKDDGKARLYRVTTAGPDKGQVLRRAVEKEGADGEEGRTVYEPDIVPVDFDPFAAMTPNIVTHRFFGKSIADLVVDIMRINTSLLRAMLDNVYLANNQRTEIAESHATKDTIDDLLNNRPGGIVRTKVPGGLNPIPNQNLGEFVFPALEYMDRKREWRSGVVRQGQGIDADALQNQSATAVSKVYSAAQAKMKLIARIMAETGFRQLFWKIHATVRKNETAARTKRLRNKWVTVDPREWKKRNDLTVTVGLGSGGKSEQMMFWGQVLSMQKETFMAPGQTLVTPKNIYNSFKKFMEAGGERAVEPYFTDPDEAPPSEPPPDPKMVEAQGKLKLKEAEMQANQQGQQAKQQTDMAAMSAKLQMDRERMIAEGQLKREQMVAEFQLKQAQMEAEFAMRERQMAVEAQLEREGMAINAQTKVATTPVKMGGEVG